MKNVNTLVEKNSDISLKQNFILHLEDSKFRNLLSMYKIEDDSHERE